MRTSKPIATISYNTPEFLKMKLDELMKEHKISDYVFIKHYKEEDEKKDHIHLWIKPNTLLDTMSLQEHFVELDQSNLLKPLKCIDFRTSKIDDFILYGLHLEAYLNTKGEERQYHYVREDFCYADEDSFEDLFNHAFRGSEFAKQYQTIQMLNNNSINPADLILKGFMPLNLAGSLNALVSLQKNQGHTYRGGRPGHEEQTEDEPRNEGQEVATSQQGNPFEAEDDDQEYIFNEKIEKAAQRRREAKRKRKADKEAPTDTK